MGTYEDCHDLGLVDPSSRSGTLVPYGCFRARVLLAVTRNGWLVRLRWFIVVAVFAILALEEWRIPQASRPFQIPVTIACLGVVNLLWSALGRRLLREFDDHKSSGGAGVVGVVVLTNAQMAVDIVALTVILRFSGGVENPMAIFYLFHVVIAALLLRPLNALLQGSWALLLFAAISVGECAGWISHSYPFLATVEDGSLRGNWLYVLSGIGVLAAGLFGTLYFTQQISGRLDEQERHLFDTNQALRRSQAELRTLQERRSRFMQTAAHQLKSPMAGIKTLVDLIRDGVATGASVQDLCDRIGRRCRDGITQVTELLTLARIQDADPTLQKDASSDVFKVVETLCRKLEPAADGKNVALSFHGQPSLLPLNVGLHENDLSDCLSNLIENGIKYTPKGGRVDATVSVDGDQARVDVVDTGMGMSPETQASMFDAHRRGNEALSAGIPGSGLGLAIVQEVVEHVGARIEVSSVVGEGSTFTIWFPLLASSQSTP